MDDRRASFPTHDSAPQVEHNILDGSWIRTENEPIEVVHKRYYLLLVVGVLLVGAASYLSPVGMMRALHCDKNCTEFTYSMVSNEAPADSAGLPEEAVALLKNCSTSHMIQKDAVFGTGGILIYPQEETNYALYLAEDSAFVYATDQNKFRYQVKNSADLYEAVLACLS